MVKYSDIHKAIVRELKNKFGNITFSTDIEEGITRPSFFIELDNITTSDFMREAIDHKTTCRIYYFSEAIDNNKVELYRVADDLKEVFQGMLLKVNDELNIEIEEVEFNIIDKVLHCYFDLEFTTDYEIFDDRPVMEDVDIDI